MTVSVVICVGSSCYVRGSERLAETFEQLIKENGLDGRVEMSGAFCMDHCSMGVSVRVGDRVYRGVEPETAVSFFNSEIMPGIREGAAP